MSVLAATVAGCKGAPSAPSPPPNNAPTLGGITVSPEGTGMAGATTYTFTARDAQDADGDALTFAWRFGDGATASGATAMHVYETIGAFTVDVTVSDGEVSLPAQSMTIQVGPTLTAAWLWAPGLTTNSQGRPFDIRHLNLVQSGGDLTGSLSPNVHFWGNLRPFPTLFPFALSGTIEPVSHPASVRFSTGDMTFPNSNGATYNFTFVGETSASGTTLTGTLTQDRRNPPFRNPGRLNICGSTDPVVTCPPEIASSVVTFTLP